MACMAPPLCQIARPFVSGHMQCVEAQIGQSCRCTIMQPDYPIVYQVFSYILPAMLTICVEHKNNYATLMTMYT